MRFKNSIKLIFENFSSIYKLLLYRLIVMVISMSLIAAIIMPNISMIINSIQLENIFNLAKEFLRGVLNGTVTSAYDEKFRDAFTAFYEFIRLKSGRIILSGVLLLVIFVIGRFLNGISNYALGGMINDHMSSLSHLGFIQSLIRDLKNACVYQIVYVAITVVYDAAAVLLTYNILFGMFDSLGFFALISASTIFIALMALKLTYLSSIMPAMIADNKTLKSAFKSSIKIDKKQRPRIFSTYVVSLYLIIYINVTMAVITLMSSLLITVPLSYLLIVCIQFVNYYTITDKKYFINYDNIVIPKKLREEEKLLNDIDI